MNNTIRPTRYKNLGYRQDDKDLWRFYDMETESSVGYQYKSKSELMGDLERYAKEYGAELE